MRYHELSSKRRQIYPGGRLLHYNLIFAPLRCHMYPRTSRISAPIYFPKYSARTYFCLYAQAAAVHRYRFLRLPKPAGQALVSSMLPDGISSSDGRTLLAPRVPFCPALLQPVADKPAGAGRTGSPGRRRRTPCAWQLFQAVSASREPIRARARSLPPPVC